MVELKVTGLDGVLDMLKKLPPEIVSKRGGPVRAALRKGALVIQKQEKANLQAIISGTNDEGERLSTGLLMDNVIVSRGKLDELLSRFLAHTASEEAMSQALRQAAGVEHPPSCADSERRSMS